MKRLVQILLLLVLGVQPAFAMKRKRRGGWDVVSLKKKRKVVKTSTKEPAKARRQGGRGQGRKISDYPRIPRKKNVAAKKKQGPISPRLTKKKGDEKITGRKRKRSKENSALAKEEKKRKKKKRKKK